MHVNEVLCERKHSVARKQGKGSHRVQQASQQRAHLDPVLSSVTPTARLGHSAPPQADQETLLWQNPWETLLPKNTPIFPAPLKHRQNKGYQFKAYTF